jgi:hypothetical protein
MTNFKGTQGKWSEHKSAFCCVVSDNGVLVANCGGRTSNVNPEELILEQQANTLLISKSPQMLEMLEELINNSDVPNELYDKAKQLIKEATSI